MSDLIPEPWPSVERRSRDGGFWLSAEDYARARACINACAGIPTEQLGDVARLIEAIIYYDKLTSAPPSLEASIVTAEAWLDVQTALAPFRKD